MDVLREEGKVFDMWVSSERDDKQPRTSENTPDDFVVSLRPDWIMNGTWSVKVIDAIMSEVNKTKTVGEIMIYTDFIEYAIVGHGMFPLLETIGYTGTSSVIRNQSKVHPLLRKLNKARFQELGIKLADGSGKAPVFLDATKPTLLCLRFEPRALNFDKELMDLTFLSNQSLKTYPENGPSSFTAVLPAPITLQNSQKWRAGAVSITLPPIDLTQKLTRWRVYLEPNFPLPSSAITSVEIGDAGSLQALMKDYNAQMKTLVSSWFPLDTNLGGFGIGGCEMKITVDGVKKTLRFDGSLTLSEFHDRLRRESNNTILSLRTSMIMSLRVLGTTTIQWDGSQTLLKRLGFTKDDATTPTFKQVWGGDNTPLNWYVASSSTLFDGKNGPFMIGSYMFDDTTIGMPFDQTQTKTILRTSFYHKPDTGYGGVSLTLSLPEAMYDLLGMNKKNLPTRFIRGIKYVETIVKNGYTFPHNVATLTVDYEFTDDLHFYSTTQEVTKKKNIPLDPVSKLIEFSVINNAVRVDKLAHVTCDAMDLRRIGDRSLSLLDIVPLSASASQGDSSQPMQYVYSPHTIKHNLLKTSTLHHIKFNVEDENGEKLNFTKNGVTTITVRLLKQ